MSGNSLRIRIVSPKIATRLSTHSEPKPPTLAYGNIARVAATCAASWSAVPVIDRLLLGVTGVMYIIPLC